MCLTYAGSCFVHRCYTTLPRAHLEARGKYVMQSTKTYLKCTFFVAYAYLVYLVLVWFLMVVFWINHPYSMLVNKTSWTISNKKLMTATFGWAAFGNCCANGKRHAAHEIHRSIVFLDWSHIFFLWPTCEWWNALSRPFDVAAGFLT